MSETPAYTPELAWTKEAEDRLTRYAFPDERVRTMRLQYAYPAASYGESDDAMHADLRSALAEIARLQSREAELAGALKPFATAFETAEGPAISHGDYVAMRNYVDIQDFRNAAKALSPSPGEEG